MGLYCAWCVDSLQQLVAPATRTQPITCCLLHADGVSTSSYSAETGMLIKFSCRSALSARLFLQFVALCLAAWTALTLLQCSWPPLLLQMSPGRSWIVRAQHRQPIWATVHV